MGARILVLGFSFAATSLAAQEPQRRMLCDPSNPANKCPGESCFCTDDVLEVVFDDGGTSVLAIDEPSVGTPVDMTVFMDVKSPVIQGWSYGIAHDRNRILLESVAFEGTDARKEFQSGFQVTSMEQVQTCPPMDEKCAQPEEGGGYIQAIVLSLGPAQLPLGRNSLSRARYIVREDSADPQDPIVLAPSDRLKRRGSPPTTINFTERGRTRRPRTVVDGWILSENRPFRRGDADGDGRASVLDAISLLRFLFLSGPLPGCLEAADFDDDGRIDGTDVMAIFRRLFLHGPAPADPGHEPECGRDPDGSAVNLGCGAYGGC